MNCGTLGESDDSGDSLHVGRRSIETSNNRTTRLSNAGAAGPSSKNVNTTSRRKKRTTIKKTSALNEIARLQASTDLLIPKLTFARLVREITMHMNSEVTRYSILALQALQEATEMYITQFFTDVSYLAHHRKRVTISKADMELLILLRG